MADKDDGIQILLEKADLRDFLDSFIKLGTDKVSHYVDCDKEMMTGIGLTPLQIKRLDRIFGTHFSNTHECCGNSIPGRNCSVLVQEGPSGINLNPSHTDKPRNKEGKQTGLLN